MIADTRDKVDDILHIPKLQGFSGPEVENQVFARTREGTMGGVTFLST